MSTTKAYLERHAGSLRERLSSLGGDISIERLTVLLELGRALRGLDDPAAEAPLRTAADLAEALGDRSASRRATLELGAVLAARGDATAGLALLERALEGASRARDPRAGTDLALAAAERAWARARAGDLAGADDALASARRAAADEVRARVELCAARVARARGDEAAANEALERARSAAAALPPGADRSVVELAATAPAGPAPLARDLGPLDRDDLARLLEATARLAASETAAATALELALALTGAAAGDLRDGERSLARSGDPGLEGTPLEVHVGTRALALAPPTGRAFSARDELVARVLLAHVNARSEAAPSAPGRVLAMLERVLAAGFDLERLVTVATDLAVEATGAARGFLLIREPGNRLGFRAARRAGDDLVDPAGVVSRSLVREVFLSGHALLLGDAASDPKHGDAESVGARGLRSVLVAPIPDPDDDHAPAIGVLYLDDPGTVARFGAAEREVAVGFAARLGPQLRSGLERDRERAAAASARAALSGPMVRPKTRHEYPELVGHGRAIGEVLLLLDRAVDAAAPVLVTGESGTGKELVARALHVNGPRAKGPFVAISCADLADSVLESELFGHAAGAFTGATSARKGVFERAHGGTLFLDELQEASPKLQGDLLRVLEMREVRPVGGDATRKVDVRLVCATNADLGALVAAGTFRQDLYYRVAVLSVRLPPLRERIEDLPDLVAHFLAGTSRQLGPRVLERLAGDAWPGNVRALKHCLERALVLAGDGPIAPEHIVLDAPVRRAAAAAPVARGALYAGSIELNERQLGLIERLRGEGEITNTEYSEQENVSQPTGWRDLSDLVAKGVLLRSGRGKRTTYKLAPGWEARLRGS